MTDFPPPDELRRALVVKLRHHGDVLLATPVISALKRLAPQCEVDALVYAETLPMLEGHPGLLQVHVIDRRWKQQGVAAQAEAEWELLQALRARHYDLVIHLSVHTRGAWLSRLLRSRWSVAPRHRGGFWAGSFSHFYPAQSHPDRHTVESNLDALRMLGLEIADEDKRVLMVPGDEAEHRVDARLAEAGRAAGSFVHLHPASRWLFKCWPADRVAQLCDRLAERGLRAVLTAAPDEKERALVREVCAAASSSPVDWSGTLSLKELAALAARARLFVGVDSAPMHIAAAMGTPCVAIFGPSGDREWGPWDEVGKNRHRIVTSNMHPCRPCGLAGCDDSKVSECLVTLPVAQVLAACEELL